MSQSYNNSETSKLMTILRACCNNASQAYDKIKSHKIIEDGISKIEEVVEVFQGHLECIEYYTNQSEVLMNFKQEVEKVLTRIKPYFFDIKREKASSHICSKNRRCYHCIFKIQSEDEIEREKGFIYRLKKKMNTVNFLKKNRTSSSENNYKRKRSILNMTNESSSPLKIGFKNIYNKVNKIIL
uniref:Uncharacterized protein n=1 Tax=Parastrongyloides trichosuri TaxID=131310 RepID=A0A0N4ZBF8_PARTI